MSLKLDALTIEYQKIKREKEQLKNHILELEKENRRLNQQLEEYELTSSYKQAKI